MFQLEEDDSVYLNARQYADPAQMRALATGSRLGQQLCSTESTGALERRSSKSRLMHRGSPAQERTGSTICTRECYSQSVRHREADTHGPHRGHVLARQLHPLNSDASSKVTSTSSGSYQTCYETPSAIAAASAAETNAARNGSKVISLEFPTRGQQQQQLHAHMSHGFASPRHTAPKPRPKSFARLTNQPSSKQQQQLQLQPRIVAAAGSRARARGRPSPQSSRVDMPDPSLTHSHSSNYTSSSSTSFATASLSSMQGATPSSQAPTHTDSWTSSMRSDRSEQRPIFLLGFDADEDYTRDAQPDDGDQVRVELRLFLVR